MYEDASTKVRMNGSESKAFNVKVGVHQGSVLSPLLFIIMLEALSREFREGLPIELLYADDLVLIAETKELLLEVKKWKKGMEKKGLRVNAGKTKIMWCRLSMGQAEDSGEYPCGVCRKGVGDNLIFCVECRRWVHKRCSGISGKLKSNVDYHCRGCLEGENGLFQSVLLKEVVMERHTWCGRRCGGGSKSQSETCLGKVQGVISYPDSPGCIIPHKGKDIQGLCPECIDIWD